jgi:hypothetical protein
MFLYSWVHRRQERKSPKKTDNATDNHNYPSTQPNSERTTLNPSIAQQDTDENRHRAAERRVWKRQIRIAKWLNIITGAAALVGLVGLGFVYLSIIHADQGTIDANRAWLAPTGIWHNRQEAYIAGQPVSYMLLFRNIGKSPALRLNWKIENGYVTVTGQKLDVSKTTFSQEDMCLGMNASDESGVVWPDATQPTYTAGDGFPLPALPVQSDDLGSGPKIKVTQGMIDGTEAFYIRGCVAYATMTIIGKSSFCFYLNPYKSMSPTPGGGMSIQCRNGNSAE